jgi:hypothetical protein
MRAYAGQGKERSKDMEALAGSSIERLLCMSYLGAFFVYKCDGSDIILLVLPKTQWSPPILQLVWELHLMICWCIGPQSTLMSNLDLKAWEVQLKDDTRSWATHDHVPLNSVSLLKWPYFFLQPQRLQFFFRTDLELGSIFFFCKSV